MEIEDNQVKEESLEEQKKKLIAMFYEIKCVPFLLSNKLFISKKERNW